MEVLFCKVFVNIYLYKIKYNIVIYSYGNLDKIGSLLLINSFIEVDNILKDTLLKSLEVFETCPENMRELPYNYFSVINFYIIN